MQKFFRLLLLWISILSACSAIPSAPQTVPPATTEAPPIIPTTAVPSNPGGCGYQWAYQDLPELSRAFQQSLQALQPEAQGTAFAFGENCMRADGSVEAFLPMETDFNITLQVTDLNNESDLGEWIVKVMQVVTAIPPEQIVGPRPGRVSLGFQSAGQAKSISFYINQYQGLPSGLSNAVIFQQLQIPQ